VSTLLRLPLQVLAWQHYQQKLFVSWRQAAVECKQERTAMMRSAVTSQQLLLRRCWRAWRLAVAEKKQRSEARVTAAQHHRCKLLERCWEGWQEWTELCRSRGQRHAVRVQGAVFRVWRQAAKAAERR